MSIVATCDECHKELVTNDYFCCHDCVRRMFANEKTNNTKTSSRPRKSVRKTKEPHFPYYQRRTRYSF